MANSNSDDHARNELQLKLRLVVVMAIRLLHNAGISKKGAVDIVRSKLALHGLVQPPEDRADGKISAATIEHWEHRAPVYCTQLTVLTGVAAENHLRELALEAAEQSFAQFPASEVDLDKFIADGFLNHAIPTILSHLAELSAKTN